MRSNTGSITARAAATTTGTWSGVQPAMTAAMASFSTVQTPRFGPISPSTRSPSRPVGEHHALDAFGGGDDDGKAVGTAEAMELLERVGLVGREQSAGGHRDVSLASQPLSDAMMSRRDRRRDLRHVGLARAGDRMRQPVRGMSGIPTERATKSPCAQNFSVTRETAGTPRRASFTPSRTVPVVQLPQWPYAATTARHSPTIVSSIWSDTTERGVALVVVAEPGLRETLSERLLDVPEERDRVGETIRQETDVDRARQVDRQRERLHGRARLGTRIEVLDHRCPPPLQLRRPSPYLSHASMRVGPYDLRAPVVSPGS